MKIDISKYKLQNQSFEESDDIELEFHKKKSKNPESILNNVLSGTNVFYKECKTKRLNTPLFKENFLGEFLTDIEKSIVRKNLGIPTDSQIANMVDNNIKKFDYTTKTELNQAIDNIKFVDSKNNGYLSYEIPDILFKK